ncbi:hypothetical protein AVEN_48123-1, partial [Araneus ventricosus]
LSDKEILIGMCLFLSLVAILRSGLAELVLAATMRLRRMPTNHPAKGMFLTLSPNSDLAFLRRNFK